jgi:hypothetical protein
MFNGDGIMVLFGDMRMMGSRGIGEMGRWGDGMAPFGQIFNAFGASYRGVYDMKR